MMNEIPPTRRDTLRHGLADAVTAAGLHYDQPVFWQNNHVYSDPVASMEQGDLWLYHNHALMKALLAVVGDAFAHIRHRPAVTVASAYQAQRRLASAYDNDEAGIRTFLQQPPLYLDTVVQSLINAHIGDEQAPPASLQLTPPLLHDAMQALICLNSILTKQPVQSITSV